MTQGAAAVDAADAAAGGTPFRERFVEADGFRIRYLEAGAGEVLVSLHTAGGLRITAAHERLAAHRRVVAFEIPGFGDRANDRSETMQDLAATMRAAMTACGISRCDLMGHSFGGKLAVWIAAQAPEAVRSLTLIAAAAIRPEAGAAAMASALSDLPAPTLALVRRLIGPPRDARMEAALAGLTMPVLALFGTRDALIPPEIAREYRAVLPGCHIMYVYDAGHGIDLDRPEALAAVIGDFLEKPEGFLVNRQDSRLAK
jgi:pimeloyl-ACP methyl ester carboxylesterase